VRAIAQKEGFAVADFYAACGEEAELADLSIDTALHPNDPGYQRMADELIRAFGTILP
jgi:lysophospholipase L1-like esterase